MLQLIDDVASLRRMLAAKGVADDDAGDDFQSANPWRVRGVAGGVYGATIRRRRTPAGRRGLKPNAPTKTK
ncbi:MAG TPA: hypothetical protein VKH41_03565 [Myxococcota bacterium]|nr:hypothetical protein [Myxococcota bacterium]